MCRSPSVEGAELVVPEDLVIRAGIEDGMARGSPADQAQVLLEGHTYPGPVASQPLVREPLLDCLGHSLRDAFTGERREFADESVRLVRLDVQRHRSSLLPI